MIQGLDYARNTGELLHEMLTLEGSGVGYLQVTSSRIIAHLSIRHKLLTSKIIVMDSTNGDVLTEKTFVDVMAMNVVGHALILLNNQMGDFRTKISVYDLDVPNVFDSENGDRERVLFQYQHNYWKMPIFLDEKSVIHTSEEKAHLYVRDFDGFFSQFDKRSSSFVMAESGSSSASRLCRRFRQILIKRICSKCVIM